MEGIRGSPDAATTSARADDSGSSSVAEYEVFLNFRGPDTRQTFTDYLYHSLVGAGIQVFRDNEEIRKGEKIGGELLHAIESSKIYMPIFSKNYASSAWCLRELTHMVKCAREATDKVILPIFYDVKPDEVKFKDDEKHKSLYLDHLEKHKGKFSHGDVQQWKDALIEVTRINGWDLQEKGHGEITHSIVSEVLSKLMKRQRIMSDHLVGIHEHVEAFMKLLNRSPHDVDYLVIHGMGGIGKTTLASAVFNQISNQFDSQFEICSFLSDVRHGKTIDLQKQLISELRLGKSLDIHNSVDAGVEIISKNFRHKKVLLVLDDVDTMDQLSMLAGKKDWFGLGSKIIITTRDINDMPIKEEDEETSFQAHSQEFIIFEMREMNSFSALQLFSKHAFKKDSPPQEFDDISRKITSKTGGLPLALEVIGSSLYGKSKQSWKGTSKELDSMPNKKVYDKLKISYDMLRPRQREIFLDIACFFIGEKQFLPYYMWKASDYSPKSELLALTCLSLIKIVNNDTLWMHDLLRDLGREIVKLEDINVYGERSRLWEPKIAFDVLQLREGTGRIRALKLGGLSEEHNFTSEEFSKLPNLRFLQLEGGNLEGNFKNLFSKLTWLSWSNCPLELNATNLRLKKLVVLELSGNNITEYWAGWETCLVSENLKVIQITQCPNLSRTPNFSKCTKLKRLVLEGRESSLVIRGSLSKLVIDGFGQD